MLKVPPTIDAANIPAGIKITQTQPSEPLPNTAKAMQVKKKKAMYAFDSFAAQF
jgi:hypothetical protein